MLILVAIAGCKLTIKGIEVVVRARKKVIEDSADIRRVYVVQPKLDIFNINCSGAE